MQILMEKVTEKTPYKEIESVNFIIGLTLAILASCFIGTSFIVKKLSLQKLGHRGGIRAGAGGYGYLQDWTWWLGIIIMGIGEAANFTAYAFAPASLITPLGGLSVLVSAILSAKCLKEELNRFGKLGCILCLLGSILIIIHSPTEQEITSINELILRLQNPLFINYVVIIAIIVISIIFYLGPRYGTHMVIIYILLCSAIGSITVMACKGLGLALKQIFSGERVSATHYTISGAFLFIVIACIVIQMNYLNKALDLFNTNVVTPTYYVFFTSFVILASAILFEEWANMAAKDIVGNLCGFCIVVIAIYLLQGTTFGEKEHRQRLIKCNSRNEYTNIF